MVTGATGYVGGRLIPELLAAGFTVRAAARNTQALQDRSWSPDVELAQMDLEDPGQAREAMHEVHTVVFLVHSMAAGRGFIEQEKRIAQTAADAAADAGVAQIVFLGGLHPDSPLEELSAHMRSREQVARVLLERPVPAVVLEAGIVIGSGSVSFEMIRHLAERLPVMTGPSWLTNMIEPIAIRDVLYYLAHACALDQPINRSFDIGCGQMQEFRSMLTQYAEVAGLAKRRVFPLPIPAQRLSGIWISLVTPIPRSITMPLAASLAHDAVTQEHDIAQVIPDPPEGLTGYREACQRAIAWQRASATEQTWDDDVQALTSVDPAEPLPSDPEWAGHTVFTDDRVRESDDVSPEAVWQVVETIGGSNGWYSASALWRIRGWMNKIVGSYGLDRGRRLPDRLRVNDYIDWWRVESVDPGRSVTLRAELRAGGNGWLQFFVEPRDGGGVRLLQRAVFFPSGLVGRLYWRTIQPFHALIFPAMAKNILQAARQNMRDDGGVTSESWPQPPTRPAD